jgi:hypothetical protein
VSGDDRPHSGGDACVCLGTAPPALHFLRLLSALVGNPEAAPTILLEAIHDHAVEMVACPMLIAEVRENLTSARARAISESRRE